MALRDVAESRSLKVSRGRATVVQRHWRRNDGASTGLRSACAVGDPHGPRTHMLANEAVRDMPHRRCNGGSFGQRRGPASTLR